MCVLAAASVLLFAAIYVLAAALGLDTDQKKRKIRSLRFLWGALSGRSVWALVALLILALTLWPVPVIWIYFSRYGTQDEKIIQIAIFHFCIPAKLFVPAEQNNWLTQSRAFIHQERAKLLEWDTSFSHRKDLIDLRQSMIGSKGPLAYLEGREQDFNKEKKDAAATGRKNILASLLIALGSSGVSSLASWAYKAYEPRILEIIGSVVQFGP
jgi:hypothetical protein